MKNLEKNCKFYKTGWREMRTLGFYCNNTSERLRKIKEEKSLVKKIGKMLDYGACLGFDECEFFEEFSENNKQKHKQKSF